MEKVLERNTPTCLSVKEQTGSGTRHVPSLPGPPSAPSSARAPGGGCTLGSAERSLQLICGKRRGREGGKEEREEEEEREVGGGEGGREGREGEEEGRKEGHRWKRRGNIQSHHHCSDN